MEGLTPKQLRDDLQALLLNQITNVADRVFIGRTGAVALGDLPAILIYGDATTDTWNGTPRNPMFWRETTIIIELYGKAETDDLLQAVVDTSDQVYDKILDNAAFMQKIPSVPSISRRVTINGEVGAKRVGCVNMTWVFRHETTWAQC